jgi:hypothetical protein
VPSAVLVENPTIKLINLHNNKNKLMVKSGRLNVLILSNHDSRVSQQICQGKQISFFGKISQKQKQN